MNDDLYEKDELADEWESTDSYNRIDDEDNLLDNEDELIDDEFDDELDDADIPTDSDFLPNGRYYVVNNLRPYIDAHPTHEKLERIVADYNSDDEEKRNAALTDMYGVLCCYIWRYLSKNFSTYMKKYGEDLFSAALLGVMDGMKGFDPDRGAATTWFKRPIQHQVLLYINEYIGHTTSHFTAAEKKVKAAAKKKEQKGLSYTTKDLYLETGVPVKTIENALSTGKVSVSSISAAEKDIDVLATSGNPEDFLLEQERIIGLKEAIFNSDLSKEEQYVVCAKNGLFGMKEETDQNIQQTVKKLYHSKKNVNELYRDAMIKVRSAVKSNPAFYRSKKKFVPKSSKTEIAGGKKLSYEELLEEEDLLWEEEDLEDFEN